MGNRVVRSGWCGWFGGVVGQAIRDSQTRPTTNHTTPGTTLRTTLFSPENHPNHPIFDLSAHNVPRRVVCASRAADPSFSGEGGQGGLRFEDSPPQAVAKAWVRAHEARLEALRLANVGATPAVCQCGENHRGWECPFSDPLGDCRRALEVSLTNPILEETRVAMLEHWFPLEANPKPVD